MVVFTIVRFACLNSYSHLVRSPFALHARLQLTIVSLTAWLWRRPASQMLFWSTRITDHQPIYIPTELRFYHQRPSLQLRTHVYHISMHLLDLPNAALAVVLSYLDHASKIRFFSTSQAASKLMLESSKCVHLELQHTVAGDLPANKPLTQCMRMLQHARDASVELYGEECFVSWPELASQPQLQFYQQAMERVSSLLLQGMTVQFLDTAFFTAFANLRSLTLESCEFKVGPDDEAEGGKLRSSSTGAKLTHLSLVDVMPDEESLEDPKGLVASVAKQLKRLTNLKLVELDEGWDKLLECVSALGSQLTELHVPALRYITVVGDETIADRFTALNVLKLPDIQVHDKRMRALIKMHLQELEVESFKLRHSFQHKTCHWQTIRMVNVDVASLHRLPLQHKPRLEVSGCGSERTSVVWLVDSQTSADDDRAITTAAVADVAACGGLMRSRPEPMAICIDAANDQPAHTPAPPSDLVKLTLPLIAGLQPDKLVFSSMEPVTNSFLTEWHHIMRNHCPRTAGFVDCTFEPDAVCSILCSMPPAVSQVRLEWEYSDCSVTEEELKKMCENANRSVRLVLSGRQSELADFEAGYNLHKPDWGQFVDLAFVTRSTFNVM